MLLLLFAALEARAGPSPSRRASRTPRNTPPALQRTASPASSPPSARGSGRGKRGRGRGHRSSAGSPTAYPREGQRVAVLQKQHYACGTRTCGIVARVLTRAQQHSRGFKVQLTDGTVGRVAQILEEGCTRPRDEGLEGELDAILEEAAGLPVAAQGAHPSATGSHGQPSQSRAQSGAQSAATLQQLEAENSALREELEALRRGRSG